MSIQTHMGLAGLGSASGAVTGAGVSAVSPLAGLVDQRGAEFVLRSPAALEFARGRLPENKLLARSKEATLHEIDDQLSKVQGPSRGAKIGAGVITSAVSVSSTFVTWLGVYQIAGNLFVGNTVAIGVAVGLANAGGHLLYTRLARFLDGSVLNLRRRRESRDWREIIERLGDSSEMERFFAEHPQEYLQFLQGSVSETFRGEEAQSKIRLDQLNVKLAEARRMEQQRLNEIRVADISEEAKGQLSAQVRSATQVGITALEEAIGKEAEFANRLGDFISEIVAMAGAIRQEVMVGNIYAEVEQHVVAMEALAETAIRSEEARIRATLDLAVYWKRLREMGDEVLSLQLAQREVHQLLGE